MAVQKKKVVQRVPAAVPMRAAVKKAQATAKKVGGGLVKASTPKEQYWPSKSSPKRIPMSPESTAYGRKKKGK